MCVTGQSPGPKETFKGQKGPVALVGDGPVNELQQVDGPIEAINVVRVTGRG